jgi:fructosamine-3-kinase
VGGGCIHRAWRLELADGRRLFAKTNRLPLKPVLAAEADGLAALHQAAVAARTAEPASGTLVVPEPLALVELGGDALLLLPWLELDGRAPNPEQAWRQLGAGLAALHRASLTGHDGRFGWEHDNFIGSGPQPNGWNTSWPIFFRDQRLAAQLAWAPRSGHRLRGAEELLARVPEWLADHPADPCLVHGDLWSGNAGLVHGGGALFDPAVYRGDREVDLAMAHLFGGFPTDFFAGYEARWPRATGHQQRRELYNLYHLLNHANLFGGSYWQQAERSMTSLLQSWR